ncbi:DUF4328 domain-containing protein (plasmid) [Streptomyces sp. NBC_00984]|uniref:DUF4328 domain-containing protein n=1 Tax=Streptomyces sp. NBC_00984 TaxID=2903700 RepID=UPI002F90CCDD|nr:DUF4328 domain-containing protein [Streptomyces sp. NBC_00984]
MDGSQQSIPAGASPAGAEQRRTVTGAANVATVLISLALVREVLVSVGNWRLYVVVHDYLAGRATTADLEAVDSGALATVGGMWPWLLVSAAAGVAFVVWLWRVRINAEVMSGATAHRRSRGWVVGSWFAPVVNMWIPYQVVSDVWRASARQRAVPVTLVTTWWALFVAANIVVRPIQWRMAFAEADSEQDLLSNANVSTLLTVLYLAAGMLIILIVRRITAWQTHGHAKNTA